MSNSSNENVRTAGRGGLAIAGAKIYFILVGFVQQLVFNVILGLSGYGALATALSTVSVVTNPITQASIQGVSREIASAPEDARPGVLRRTLRFHAVVSIVLALVFYLLAGTVAQLLGATHVAPTLRILSGVLFAYGIYTPLVGALNGLRRFLSQAALDVLAATLRTAGLLGGAYWAVRGGLEGISGPSGAALGFVVAALIVLVVALVLVGVGRPGGRTPQLGNYVGFLLPVVIGQLLLNLLFQADGLLLRRFAADAALSSGLAAEAADPLVGAYRAAQLFGFLPYQLLMSVTFILFPLLASARAAGDRALIRQYVQSGMRLAVLLSGLMASVLFSVPRGLIGLAYGAEAASLGSEALRVLALGLSFLAVLGVMMSALNSLGGQMGSLLVTFVALLLVGALCFLFVRGGALDAALLVRTAWATSLGLALATVLAAGLVYQVAGGVVPPLSLLRAGLATAVSAGLGSNFALTGALGTLLSAGVVAVVYLLVLGLTRELAADDLSRLRAIAGRGKSA